MGSRSNPEFSLPSKEISSDEYAMLCATFLGVNRIDVFIMKVFKLLDRKWQNKTFLGFDVGYRLYLMLKHFKKANALHAFLLFGWGKGNHSIVKGWGLDPDIGRVSKGHGCFIGLLAYLHGSKNIQLSQKQAELVQGVFWG